jgi:streptogramin lyase
MSRLGMCIMLVLVAPVLAARESPPFPPGTAAFYGTFVLEVVPAREGGVWVSTTDGLARYTAAGRAALFVFPGGSPFQLALAHDGTVWFSNTAGIGRSSSSGTLLEQYAIAGVGELAVASDGALWYWRGFPHTVGRIVAGGITEFNSLPQAWTFAPGDGGDMWVMPTGSGVNDTLQRISPNGVVTTVHLGSRILFGQVQALADGTLYAATGNGPLYRLPHASTTPEQVLQFYDAFFLADEAHNIWSSRAYNLRYLPANGSTTYSVTLPFDARDCYWAMPWTYHPLAFDSEGGLWLNARNESFGIPEMPPCPTPDPPIPALVRLSPASVMPSLVPVPIPALAPYALAALATAFIATALLRLRLLNSN